MMMVAITVFAGSRAGHENRAQLDQTDDQVGNPDAIGELKQPRGHRQKDTAQHVHGEMGAERQ